MKYLDFDPANYLAGTRLDSLGFTQFNAENPVGTPQGDADWQVVAGPTIAAAINGGYALQPRILFDTHAQFIRGEARMRIAAPPYTALDRVVILSKTNGEDFLLMKRQTAGLGGGIEALGFAAYFSGVAQPTSGGSDPFPYWVSAADNGYPVSFPDVMNVSWVVTPDGANLQIFVEGQQMVIHDFLTNASLSEIPLPAQLIGASAAGFFAQPFGYNSNYAANLVVRDNADITQITSVTASRFDATTSALTIAGTCNVTSAATMTIQVYDENDVPLIGPFTTPLTGGAFSFTTPVAIPKVHEQKTLKITAINNEGTADLCSIFFAMPRTLTLQPTRLGQNDSTPNYYAGYWPYNDLAKALHWRVTAVPRAPANTVIASQTSGTPGGAGVYQLNQNASASGNGVLLAINGKVCTVNITAGQKALTVVSCPSYLTIGVGQNVQDQATYMLAAANDPAVWQANGEFPNYLPACVIGMASNGAPTKFPDDQTVTLATPLPWFPETGDYVMDMSGFPDLIWTFGGITGFNIAGCSTDQMDFVPNFFAPLQHLVRINTSPLLNWSLNLTRNDAAANDGMPTDAPLLTMAKVGSKPDMIWNQSYLNWWAQSGASHIRYMSSEDAREPYAGLPPAIISAAMRTTLTDQAWACLAGQRPCHPFEGIVQLAKVLGKDAWINISRLCDDSYRREVAALVRDGGLPNGVMFLWAMADEAWNFNFPEYNGYQIMGVARGLGKRGAVTATTVNGGTLLTATNAQGFIQVGAAVSGPNIQPGTTIVPGGTGTGGNGTYTLSLPATSDGSEALTIDAAVFGADNGSYDFSATGGLPVAWSDATWAQGSYCQSNGLLFYCHTAVAVTGNPDPGVAGDAAHWVLFQDGNLARQRAHVEDILALRASMVDVFGGEVAFKARNKIVCEVRDLISFNDVSEYLDWGNASASYDMVAIAAYTDGSVFNAPTASSATLDAICNYTGADRISRLVTIANASADAAVAAYHAEYLDFVQKLEARGLVEGAIEYGVYEGGPTWQFAFSNAALEAAGRGDIDQNLWLQDVIAMYHDDSYQPHRQLWDGIMTDVGGTCTNFDSFFNMPYNYSTPQGSYLHWGVSNDVNDVTAGMYEAVRDSSIAHGGGAVVDLPSSQRRRAQPAIL